MFLAYVCFLTYMFLGLVNAKIVSFTQKSWSLLRRKNQQNFSYSKMKEFDFQYRLM